LEFYLKRAKFALINKQNLSIKIHKSYFYAFHSIITKYFNARRLIMQNDDLKSLVTHMHDNLLDLIDQQDNATAEQVVTYLQDAISTLEGIDDFKQNSVKDAKDSFTNTYKEIAVSSLVSYRVLVEDLKN